MLARRIGMYYSLGVYFQTSLVNMEESNYSPREINRKRSNQSGAGVAPSSTYELPQRIALWDLKLERPKNWPWGWEYLNPKQKRQHKMHQLRK